jgi:hypothetical protein
LAELHAAPDPKKTPTLLQFFQPNTPSSGSSTVDLKKKVEQAQLYGFVEYLMGCSTKPKFRGVEVKYPPLPSIISGK